MSDRRFEFLNSKQLAEEQAKASIVYFPTGSLEHHGQHIPVGFDSLWVHKACLSAAERTGGVVMPPNFWGTGPCISGIEKLPGSVLLKGSTIVTLISDVLTHLIAKGYQTIVAVPGHNPGVLGKLISTVKANIMEQSESFRNVRIIEPMNLVEIRKYAQAMKPDSNVKPDHAGKFETSLAFHLYPSLISLENLASPEGKIGIDPFSVEEANPEFGQEIFEGFVDYMAGLVLEG